MLEMIIGWVWSALAVLFFIYMTVWNIVRLGYWIKCRKVEFGCGSRDCPYRRYCDKWTGTVTGEQVAGLYRLIELLKGAKINGSTHINFFEEQGGK